MEEWPSQGDRAAVEKHSSLKLQDDLKIVNSIIWLEWTVLARERQEVRENDKQGAYSKELLPFHQQI